MGKTGTIIWSHVFWFKSFSSSYKYATHVRLEDGDNVVSSMCVEQQEGSRGVKLRNQGQPIEQLEHGRVSTVELIQALEEMLSGAGIRMDTEKQCLFQTTLSLQEQLKESQAPLLLEQANFNDKYEEYRKKWGGGIMGLKSQAKTKAKESDGQVPRG